MRSVRRLIAATAVTASAVAATSGCADNESMLFVRAVLAVSETDCVAQADPSAPTLLGGTLDVAFQNSYQAALLVGNQLVQRGSRDQLRTETARITLRGVEVQLLDSQERLITEFTVASTGFVDPSSGDTPGYGVATATLIPPSVIQQFRDQFGSQIGSGATVIAQVRAFGDTLGGDEVESGQLSFPIEVCYCCLASYPIEADDPAQPGFQCVGSSDQSVEFNGCRVGQDTLVDCRLLSNPDICLP